MINLKNYDKKLNKMLQKVNKYEKKLDKKV